MEWRGSARGQQEIEWPCSFPQAPTSAPPSTLTSQIFSAAYFWYSKSFLALSMAPSLAVTALATSSTFLPSNTAQRSTKRGWLSADSGRRGWQKALRHDGEGSNSLSPCAKPAPVCPEANEGSSKGHASG